MFIEIETCRKEIYYRKLSDEQGKMLYGIAFSLNNSLFNWELFSIVTFDKL